MESKPKILSTTLKPNKPERVPACLYLQETAAPLFLFLVLKSSSCVKYLNWANISLLLSCTVGIMLSVTHLERVKSGVKHSF